MFKITRLVALKEPYKLVKLEVIIVENLTFDTYFMNALRSWRALRCLILFTAESAKVAKISLKCLVFNYKLEGKGRGAYYVIV